MTSEAPDPGTIVDPSIEELFSMTGNVVWITTLEGRDHYGLLRYVELQRQGPFPHDVVEAVVLVVKKDVVIGDPCTRELVIRGEDLSTITLLYEVPST